MSMWWTFEQEVELRVYLAAQFCWRVFYEIICLFAARAPDGFARSRALAPLGAIPIHTGPTLSHTITSTGQKRVFRIPRHLQVQRAMQDRRRRNRR